MLKLTSEIKLWTLGTVCQRGFRGMRVCFFHSYVDFNAPEKHHLPMANSSGCDTCFCLCIWVSSSLSHHVYPWTATSPRVASLASMAQANTLKKCKAADQSGLERQSTRRPQCESLSFGTIGPAHLAPMLPAGCGGRYRCVITPDREQHSTQVPSGSESATSLLLIYGSTQQFRNISAPKNAAPSKLQQTKCFHIWFPFKFPHNCAQTGHRLYYEQRLMFIHCICQQTSN